MDKLAVITGGSKGIGKALAETFAAQGFHLALCARREADLQALATQLSAEHQVKVFTRSVDVSSKESCQQFCAWVQGLSIPVEVLVNNAGVFLPGGILSEEEGAYEKMLDTNLSSAYYITRGLVPSMVARKSGYVFNICSIASFMAYANGGSYAITKHGMLGMTKVLREETKTSGVRVSAVMPGAVLTDSWAGVDLPDSRFIKPEDIASAIWSAYQLSPSAVVEQIIIRPQLGDI